MKAQSDEIRRICIVRFGGMGDILLATPAVRALARHFQTADIDFVVGRGMKPALDGISYLSDVIEFDKKGKDASWWQLMSFLWRLRGRKYDLFINFQPSIKTRLMAFASGAPRVLKFRKDRTRQIDTSRVRHAVDDFTKEIEALGIAAVEDRSLDFVVPPAALAHVRLLLAKAGIEDSESFLVINPAATRIINRWPPEKFVALLDALPSRLPEIRVVLVGGPADADLVRDICSRTRLPVTNLAGKLTVKELGALLSLSDAVVTADTGPMHIASAVGAPLVVLSGAADPDRTGPLSPRDLVVINRSLDCVPCQARYCRRGDIACMTQMPVEWVLRAIVQRLKAAQK